MAYIPGQKVSYKQPRKITPAKIGVLFGVAAAIYLGWILIPPYYAYYRANTIMKDESSKAYSKRHQAEGWGEIENQIHRTVRNRLLAILKVPSEQLTVTVKKGQKSIVITAKWSVYIRWWPTQKRHKLSFDEKIETSLR